MYLWLIPLALSLSFGILALLFTKRKRSFLLGSLLGIAVLLPFRAYKISPLAPHFEKALCDDSILRTKEITIPGYPGAYNPSLLAFKDGYLLSFRVKSYNFSSYLKKVWNVRTSYIGLVPLNRQFEVSAEPYLLDLGSHSAQDARLFQFGEKILLFFNDYGATRTRSCYSLYVTELCENNGKLQPISPPKLLQYERMLTIEKNWIPFACEEKLYLIYSGEPHLILEADLETGLCKSIASTESHFPWQWGEIRGGTPAYLIGEHFLTFFHSSQELPAASLFGTKVGRNYAMGAYLFENKPPFAIQKMSPSPLGKRKDYLLDNRRKVLFPSGMAIDQNEIHVAWGKNDSGIWVTTFDREKLLISLASKD